MRRGQHHEFHCPKIATTRCQRSCKTVDQETVAVASAGGIPQSSNIWCTLSVTCHGSCSAELVSSVPVVRAAVSQPMQNGRRSISNGTTSVHVRTWRDHDRRRCPILRQVLIRIQLATREDAKVFNRKRIFLGSQLRLFDCQTGASRKPLFNRRRSSNCGF